MNAFDWQAEPVRPLSLADVWEFMCNGLNALEIATAGHVSTATARTLMAQACDLFTPKQQHRVLRRAA